MSPTRTALPAAPRCICSRYVCSSTSKYAYIGESDTTVVSSVALSTRLPAVTMARDTRPAIGDVTRVNERLSFAASSSAPAAASRALATAAFAASCSYSSRDVAFCASSRSARSAYERARPSSAAARSRSAVSRSTSAWNGRGSILKEQVARSDSRALDEPDGIDVPADPRPNRDVMDGFEPAGEVGPVVELCVATTAVVTSGAGGAWRALPAWPAPQPVEHRGSGKDRQAIERLFLGFIRSWLPQGGGPTREAAPRPSLLLRLA